MNTRSISLFIVLLLGTASLWAEGLFHPRDADRVGQVDVDHDGRLQRIEVLLGLKNKLLESTLNLPAIRQSGKIPAALQEELEKGAKERGKNGRPGPLAAAFADFTDRHGASEPWAISHVDPDEFGIKNVDLPGPTKAELAAEPRLKKWDLKVRRSKEDLAKPIEDPYGQGALFSYGRNYNSHTDTWTMRGVAELSYSLSDNPAYDPALADKNTARGNAAVDGVVSLNEYRFNLVTSWDKVQVSPGAAGEVNSLRFDLGMSGSFSLGPDTILRHVVTGFELKASGFWITDFDFEKQIYGGELEWYPRINLPGCQQPLVIGSYTRYDAPASILTAIWTPWAHVEGGSIQETGPGALLNANDSFARAGGGVSLQLWVLPEALDQRLTLQAKYLYYEGLLSDVETSHLFSASAQYVIPVGSGLYQRTPTKGDEEHPIINRERDLLVTLRVEYTDGELPVTQQRDHFILLGVGVAF